MHMLLGFIGHILIDVLFQGAAGVLTRTKKDAGHRLDRQQPDGLSIAGLFLLMGVLGIAALLGLLAYLLYSTATGVK